MNKKYIILGIITGIFILIGTGYVYATTVVSSKDISYTNENLSADNVQDVIDEIYNKRVKKRKIIAYTYSETGDNLCINGEEKTCVETTCYEDKTANSCAQGTIIKYYVNDNEQKVFYVLHDDGDTITMQQRENTVRNIAWYKDVDDNTKGPLTILPYLEAATATWTNVEFQEYTAGYTNFYENAYTGCTYDSNYKITCSANTYNSDENNLTLSKRKVRARMITAQEASSTGCLAITEKSCPIWMYNYLYQSTNYGGKYEDNTLNEENVCSYGYWMMSSSIVHNTSAWFVYRTGTVSYNVSSHNHLGARAVVVISK